MNVELETKIQICRDLLSRQPFLENMVSFIINIIVQFKFLGNGINTVLYRFGVLIVGQYVAINTKTFIEVMKMNIPSDIISQLRALNTVVWDLTEKAAFLKKFGENIKQKDWSLRNPTSELLVLIKSLKMAESDVESAIVVNPLSIEEKDEAQNISIPCENMCYFHSINGSIPPKKWLFSSIVEETLVLHGV